MVLYICIPRLRFGLVSSLLQMTKTKSNYLFRHVVCTFLQNVSLQIANIVRADQLL
jgi:hypothetical protein